MSDVYDPDALWLKARLFVNHAMDPAEPREFDERALWATLALELLGKAALARVSPLLIALPNEDGDHLLAAAGLLSGEGLRMTIPAKTVFSRCALAFRPFNSSESLKFANNRNQYLHGGAGSFAPIPEAAWWPSFWSQAVILVVAQDRTLGEFVGEERVELVESHLARNRQHLAERVEALIGRARQQLALVQSGNATARVMAMYQQAGHLMAGLLRSATATCPACGASGTVEGEQEADFEIRYEQIGEDDFDAFVDVAVYPDYFSCPRCRLVLDGTELLEAAGFDDTFHFDGDISDYVSEEYGND